MVKKGIYRCQVDEAQTLVALYYGSLSKTELNVSEFPSPYGSELVMAQETFCVNLEASSEPEAILFTL